ncbi:MAG: carboxypeptidase regulatory-like domain-containing protein [bacterium]
MKKVIKRLIGFGLMGMVFIPGQGSGSIFPIGSLSVNAISNMATVTCGSFSTVTNQVSNTLSLLIQPSSGPVGSVVTVQGAGFGSETKVTLDFGNTPAITTTTSSEDGTFSVTFIIDIQLYGTTIITATSGTGYSTGIFFILPQILVSPISGPVGTVVTVQGSGFGDQGSVRIDFGTNQTITTAETAENGTFSATFTVDNQGLGIKVITAYSDQLSACFATTTITVTTGDPATITLTAPVSVSADISTTTVSAYVTDQNNNPATTTVYFSLNDTFKGTATTQNGTATVTILNLITPGIQTIKATVTTTLFATTTITVTTGDPATITLTAPTSVSADIGTTTASAYITDQNNNTVTTTVYWTTTGGTIIATSTTTNGTATAVFVCTTPATYTITATVTETLSATRTITVTPGNPATITLTALSSVSADIGTATASAYIVDQNNNTVTTTVYFSLSNTFKGTATTQNGTATFTISDLVTPGIQTIKATVTTTLFATTTITVIGKGSFTITKSAPVTGIVGSTITYTIIATNTGKINIDNVMITDTLPGSVTAGTTTWSIGLLTSMATYTISFVATICDTVENDLNLVNTAVITGTDTCGHAIFATATASTQAKRMAKISGRVWDLLTKDGIGSATVTMGGKIATTTANGSYTITNITPGDYTLVVGSPEYYPATRIVNITSDSTQDVGLCPLSRNIAANTWRMGSPPANPLDATTVSGNTISIGKDLGTIDQLGGLEMRTYRWNQDASDDPLYSKYIRPPVIKTGESYWFKSYGNSVNLKVDGIANSSTQTIPLSSGWNQIGNPFNFMVEKENIKIGTQSLSSDLWGWTDTEYKSSDAILPWKGYFVYADMPCNLTISPTPYDGTGVNVLSILDASPVEWSIKLSARSGIYSDTENLIGVGKYGKGTLDREPPIPWGSYVRLSIGGFARDIRERMEDSNVWNISLLSNETGEPVTLSWSDVSAIPKEYGVWLIDGDKVIDMRKNSEFRIQNSELKIKVAKGGIINEKLEITEVISYPNPTSGEVTFRSTLRTGGADLKVKLYNIVGQVVAETGLLETKKAIDEKAQVCIYSSKFSCLNTGNQKLANGLYFFQIEASQNGKTVSKVGRMVIKK